MEINAIVAGAGIWGCTVARVLAESGRKVLVLERRAACGGNVRCETDPETGIEIHSYGSHIFHTGNDAVWNFIRRFCEFNGYQHKVLARYNGRTYFLPLGLALVNSFYGLELTPSELAGFLAKEIAASGIEDETPSFETQAISFIGRPLYEAFIREYTRKQWGMDPKLLPASIIRRLPVRSNYDINYFPDYRQGIPVDGYNSIFSRMLDHPGITVECNRAFELAAADLPQDVPVFYSGPIDELFSHRFGPLPWRSLRFERERVAMVDFQGASVVNYTGADVPYTRIHEFKHFHPEDGVVMSSPSTIICREYPKTWTFGDEPYYPVDMAESRALLERYRAEAAKHPRLIVGGRLGGYRYLDMDKSIADALATVERTL